MVLLNFNFLVIKLPALNQPMNDCVSMGWFSCVFHGVLVPLGKVDQLAVGLKYLWNRWFFLCVMGTQTLATTRTTDPSAWVTTLAPFSWVGSAGQWRSKEKTSLRAMNYFFANIPHTHNTHTYLHTHRWAHTFGKGLNLSTTSLVFILWGLNFTVL